MGFEVEVESDGVGVGESGGGVSREGYGWGAVAPAQGRLRGCKPITPFPSAATERGLILKIKRQQQKRQDDILQQLR